MCPVDFVMNNLLCSFLSEGFSDGGQSSVHVAGYSQLPFHAASQTHLRGGIEGNCKHLYDPNNCHMALIL